MNVVTFRWLDRWVGTPILWVLSLFCYLLRRKTPSGLPKRIALNGMTELGALTLLAPAVSLLSTYDPSVTLYLIGPPLAKNLAVLFGITPNRVLCIRLRQSLWQVGIDMCRLVTRVWRWRLDAVITIDVYLRLPLIVSALTRAPIQVGFYPFSHEGLSIGRTLTHRVLYNYRRHIADNYVALVQRLYTTSPAPCLMDPDHKRLPLAPATYPVTEKDRVAVRQRFSLLTGAGPLVVIQPNPSDEALFPLRRWPLSAYQTLINQLLTDIPTCRIILTGLNEDARSIQPLLAHHPPSRLASIAGETSFIELIAVFSLASVCVTTDSGPAHFASMVKCPTVVLFGPESPDIFGPLGQHVTVIYKALPCSPCIHVYNGKTSPCQDNQCMTTITVDEVKEAVCHILGDPLRLR